MTKIKKYNMFYKGQKVVLITNLISQEFIITKDSVYTVLDVIECCSIILLDIGISFPKNFSSCYCRNCGNIISYKSVLANSIYFRPLETFGETITKELEEKINKEQEMFITI